MACQNCEDYCQFGVKVDLSEEGCQLTLRIFWFSSKVCLFGNYRAPLTSRSDEGPRELGDRARLRSAPGRKASIRILLRKKSVDEDQAM